jgi:hypothetical protein
MTGDSNGEAGAEAPASFDVQRQLLIPLANNLATALNGQKMGFVLAFFPTDQWPPDALPFWHATNIGKEHYATILRALADRVEVPEAIAAAVANAADPG